MKTDTTAVEEYDVGKDEEKKDEEKKGKKKFFLMLLAGLGALGFFFKKKRDRELDESLWEEPRDL